MIAIVNVDNNVKRSGPHKYELRINNNVVTTFIHNREDPLHECLLKAAIAAEVKVTPVNGRIKPFFEPRYDEVFFKGLEYLNSL